MHRPPTLFVVVMLTLLGVTAACVVAAFWVPQTVLIAIGTGVVFIGLAAWMIFTLPRGRSAGWRAETHRRGYSCPACGYSREGLPAGVCPECGYQLAQDDARKNG
ncbi:MAG TPA: hypothetical protein VHN77_06525 [Phycisphaerales bacterium]|nr:hypothetical protein [Phycisphaerales bacterium]